MKTKHIPALVMLLGCSVAAIVTYINGYSFEKTLKILLAVLFIFLFMGLIIKRLFDKYIPVIEEEEAVAEDEGSVIEKQVDEDGNPIEPKPEVISEEGLEEASQQAEDV